MSVHFCWRYEGIFFFPQGQPCPNYAGSYCATTVDSRLLLFQCRHPQPAVGQMSVVGAVNVGSFHGGWLSEGPDPPHPPTAPSPLPKAQTNWQQYLLPTCTILECWDCQRFRHPLLKVLDPMEPNLDHIQTEPEPAKYLMDKR